MKTPSIINNVVLLLLLTIIPEAYAYHEEYDFPSGNLPKHAKNKLLLDFEINAIKKNRISFELVFREHPQNKINKILWVLSIYNIGQLEINSKTGMIAEVSMTDRTPIDGDEIIYNFTLNKKYVNTSYFVLRTYPLRQKPQVDFLIKKWKFFRKNNDDLDIKSPDMPMTGINYRISLKALLGKWEQKQKRKPVK